MSDLELNASALYSKFGFNDGDLISDYWFDEVADEPFPDIKMLDDSPWLAFEHRVQCALVREHLVPLLPGIEVYDIWTAHNPMRSNDDRYRGSDVSVVVPRDVVLAKVRELAALELYGRVPQHYLMGIDQAKGLE